MKNIPLWEKPKKIESQFSPNADLVLCQGDVRDFVSTVPDISIGLIITSPPYNLGKDCEDRVSIEASLDVQAQVIAHSGYRWPTRVRVKLCTP